MATPFAEARDELFQQIMRCGVVGSAPEDQKDWFDNTMDYLAERYHELTPAEVGELRVLGGHPLNHRRSDRRFRSKGARGRPFFFFNAVR